MRNDIVGLAQQYAQQRVQIAAKRIAIPTAFGVVAAIFFLIVLTSLFAALFYWLASLYGPVTAALIVAAVALVLGLIALLPVVVGRRPPAAPPPAPISTTPQVAALLAVCDATTAIGARDRAVVMILVRLGLRAGEVARLSLDDIDWAGGHLTVTGKGREHTLPIPVDVGQALAAWLYLSNG